MYVADGDGSGNWASVGTSSFTGMIADFAAPVAPTGWLELDGSVISTSTYGNLFAVMSINTTGTRTLNTTTISSIPSTSNFLPGYYVFGTGIASGTTIVSVDSATQITISTQAASSGTASFFVCPWLMNTGTVTLPDVKTAARYRRSRGPGGKVGDLQADQYAEHTHTASGTTSTETAWHTHNFSGTTGLDNQNHSHTVNTQPQGWQRLNAGAGAFAIYGSGDPYGGAVTSSSPNSYHNHSYSGTTSTPSNGHSHNFSFTTDARGWPETRPVTLVVLTCIKT